MGIIKWGYSLQFVQRPPCFSGMVPTSVQSKDAHVLHSEVMTLLAKGAIETVPPAQSESGFYSLYLLVPKKGWRPPAHPRSQTPESRPHEEIVQDDHAEADPLANSHRGLVLFSGPERRILSHPDSPHHRRFLWFAFEGVAYQYTVLPLDCLCPPPTFTKCMDVALSPLRQTGTHILNYLDDWLVLAQSEVELLSHRTHLLSHLERLGLGQFRQEHAVPQPANIVPGNSSRHSSNESRSHVRTCSGHAKTRGFLLDRCRSPSQNVSENAGPHGRSIASTTAGPASHAAPSALVETTGSIPCMASWTPTYQGEPGLYNGLSPLEEPSLDGKGRGHGNGLQEKGCHDRCLQHRLGGAVRRQTDFRPLVERGERAPHQLLGNASSMSSLPVLPARPKGTDLKGQCPT